MREEVMEMEMSIMPLELILDISPYNPLLRIATQILNFITKLMPGLFGCQGILVATLEENRESTK